MRLSAISLAAALLLVGCQSTPSAEKERLNRLELRLQQLEQLEQLEQLIHRAKPRQGL
jgi:type II secretory pathway component PulJ